MIQLHNKDCLAVLAEMPDNSIDAVVTDPPYGMSQHSQQDIVAALTAWLEGEEYVHGKGGFMGKTWDSFVPSPAVWREVLRVLKPGGHILCAASTRTVDLMGISLRLGGFEIRDTITELYDSNTGKQAFFNSLNSEQLKLLQRGFGELFSVEYCYGSGFPKSLNISKAIDKAAGAEREVIGIRLSEGGKTGSQTFKGGSLVNASKEIPVTAPATESAKQWEGFGTALKPAHEPFILARKPIEKGLTIAENCLKWGTGGLDIDGSRVEVTKEDAEFTTARVGYKNGVSHVVKKENQSVDEKGNIRNSVYNSGLKAIDKNVLAHINTGRFPANVVLSFDKQEFIMKDNLTKEKKTKVLTWLNENT